MNVLYFRYGVGRELPIFGGMKTGANAEIKMLV